MTSNFLSCQDSVPQTVLPESAVQELDTCPISPAMKTNVKNLVSLQSPCCPLAILLFLAHLMVWPTVFNLTEDTFVVYLCISSSKLLKFCFCLPYHQLIFILLDFVICCWSQLEITSIFSREKFVPFYAFSNFAD